MRLSKKIASLFLAVLLIGAAFIVPLSANAIDDYQGTTLSVTWEKDRYNANTGAKETDPYNRNIRSNTYIAIGDYSKISVSYSGTDYSWNLHFYNSNKNFISSSNGQYAYASAPDCISIPNNAKYVTISLYKVGVTLADGSNITLKGIKIPTIDTTKTGSLVINKYEMSNTSSLENKGTGTDADSNNIPSGATPLSGVTFKIQKVAEVTPTYYTKDGVKLPTAEQASSMAAIGEAKTATTNGNGMADFGSNLPLGIYLVQETNVPNQVTEKVDDFVVSIPTTKTDGTGWNYNLSIYPKNETKYASIKINKKYLAPKATTATMITNNPATFTLTKYKNASMSSVFEVDTNTYTTDSTGSVTMTALPTGYYYFLQETKAPTGYIKDYSLSFYLDKTGQVLSRDGSTVISTPPSDNKPAEIDANNSKPVIGKFIDKSRGNGSDYTQIDSIRRYNDDNNYQYYIVRVVTPNITSAMSSLKTFEVTDKLTNVDGSKIVPQIHKVTYGSNVTDANAHVLSTDAYTFKATQDSTTDTTYNTTLAFDTSKIQKNTIYFIYYKAYVKGETTNNAKVKYSTVTSGTDTTSEITSNTVTFISGYAKLKKQNYSGSALQGAEFQLFASEEDAIAKKNPVYATTNRNYSLTNNTFVSAPGDGSAYFYDIDLGSGNLNATKDYWLVETKAPNGYNLLAAPYKITVSRNGIVGEENGLIIKNSKTTTFPLTGGQGWIMFAIGAVVFFGCGTVLIIKKTKKGEMKREVK